MVADIATKKTVAKATTIPRKQTKTKVCTACHRELPLSKFYMSNSPLHSLDKKTPICKDCTINNSINLETGEIDEVKFKKILMQLDKPFYRDCLVSAKNQYLSEHSFVTEEEAKYKGADIIKIYMKNIASLRQLSSKSYSDSERDGFIQKNSTVLAKEKPTNGKSSKRESQIDDETIIVDDEQFEVTPEMIDMFGEGYTRFEYKKMNEKYEKLKLNYSLQTNIHQEALVTYVRFKVKEEIATASGNVDEAKKWYDAAQNAAEKAKLTPKQLTKADLDSGINSISELVKAVEQATDVIKILPRFKYRPNDAPDFNIWCYIDYERRLNGQPPVSYEDVYSFYDRRKEEYIKQNGDPYGIFNNDTVLNNRDTVKTFITLPDDYEDMAGDKNENS